MFRNKYTRMTLAEKRQMYKCGDGYMTLNKIPVWPVLYKKVKPGGAPNPTPTRISHPPYEGCERDEEGAQEGKENHAEGDGNNNKGEDNENNNNNNKSRSRPMEVNNEINHKVSLWNGDITTLEIDAIVRGTDTTLREKLGPHASVHKSAGPTLMKDVQAIKRCETGDSKITSGHKLPAKYIIHTVGPFFGQENPKLLQACYESCLDVILEFNIRTVAFPCISTGLYGYPNRDAAEVALRTTRKWLQRHGEKVERIIFCTFLSRDFQIYQRLMTTKYFPCECTMGNQKVLTLQEDAGEEVGGNPNERFAYPRGRRSQSSHGSLSFREKSRDRDYHEKATRERDKSRNREKSRERDTRKHWDRDQQRIEWERSRDRERNRERNWDRGRDRDFDREQRESRERSRRSEERSERRSRSNHHGGSGRMLKSSLSKSMCNLASMSQTRDESEDGSKQCSKTDDHLGKRVRYADEDDILGRRPSTRRNNNTNKSSSNNNSNNKNAQPQQQQQQQQQQPKPVLRPRSVQDNFISKIPYPEPAKAPSNLDDVMSEINAPPAQLLSSAPVEETCIETSKAEMEGVTMDTADVVDTVIQHGSLVAEVPKLDDLMSQINCPTTTLPHCSTEATLPSDDVPYVNESIRSSVAAAVPKLDDLMSQINSTTSLEEELRAASVAAELLDNAAQDKEEEEEEDKSCVDTYADEPQQPCDVPFSPSDITMSSHRYKTESSLSCVRKVSEDSGIDINTTTYASEFRPIDDLAVELSSQVIESKTDVIADTALDVDGTDGDVDSIDKISSSAYSIDSGKESGYSYEPYTSSEALVDDVTDSKDIDSKFSFTSYTSDTQITVANVDCVLDTQPGTSVDEPTVYGENDSIYESDMTKYGAAEPPSPTMKNISVNSDAIESIEETLSNVDELPVSKNSDTEIDCVDDIDKSVDTLVSATIDTPIDTLESETKDCIPVSSNDEATVNPEEETKTESTPEVSEGTTSSTDVSSALTSTTSESSISSTSSTSSTISSYSSIYSSPSSYLSSYSSSSSTDVTSSKSDVTSPRTSYTSSYSSSSDSSSAYGSYSSDSGSYRSRYGYSPSSSSSSSSYTDRYSSSTSSASSSSASSTSSISTKLEDRTWERVGATSGVTDRYDSYKNSSRYQHSDRIRAIMDKYTDRTSY